MDAPLDAAVLACDGEAPQATLPEPAREDPGTAMPQSPEALLDALFIEAFQELLAEYPIEVVPTQALEVTTPAPHVAMRSIVRASGPGLKLESVLLADVDFLAAVHPLSGDELTTSNLQDWAGELNNQLMGRLKTKCLMRDCAFELTVPKLATGSGLRTHLSRSCNYRHHRAMLPEGRMCLSLAATVDPDFVLADSATETAEVMTEGSFSFF
jgi:hypothetical protein